MNEQMIIIIMYLIFIIWFYNQNIYLPSKHSNPFIYKCRYITKVLLIFDQQNFQEFYNLTADPHQLTNTIKKLDPAFIEEQDKQLIKLSLCKGPTCREVHPPGERLLNMDRQLLNKETVTKKQAKSSQRNTDKRDRKNRMLESNTVLIV